MNWTEHELTAQWVDLFMADLNERDPARKAQLTTAMHEVDCQIANLKTHRSEYIVPLNSDCSAERKAELVRWQIYATLAAMLRDMQRVTAWVQQIDPNRTADAQALAEQISALRAQIVGE